MKKKWKKPELQVLIRGKIEESVLCYCKTRHSHGPNCGDCDQGGYCGNCKDLCSS